MPLIKGFDWHRFFIKGSKAFWVKRSPWEVTIRLLCYRVETVYGECTKSFCKENKACCIWGE
jgi:hypothetical protein